jgi:predicted negative regulator of RcsB-dependent stress response
MYIIFIRPVLNDLKVAQMSFPKDRDISVVLETLQLSADALSSNPTQLAGQLTGRIHGYSAETAALVETARGLMDSEDFDDATKALMKTLSEGLETLMKQLDEKNQVKFNDILVHK